jgi:anti-sigma factor ChrR (cupin superfamily)
MMPPLAGQELIMTTAFTPNAPHHATLGPLASRICNTEAMPWEPARYPGVFTKTLMVDRTQGLVTVLLKMEPGAGLPDHEHALIEQTLMLEGTLMDVQGPEQGLVVRKGEYVFRPAGSRHAVVAPEGAVMIAMFQAPNRFFEAGTVVDMMGNDWGATWGHVIPAADNAVTSSARG